MAKKKNKIIRLLMVDDHVLVRQALRKTIETQADFQVIGEASNGREAVLLTQELKPDVVLMDIAMNELNGVEATRQILDSQPETNVLALSIHGDQGVVGEMLRAGVRGFLIKACDTEELFTAIRYAAAKLTYLCPSVAGSVVDVFLGRQAKTDSPAYTVLSSREREVLQLLAEGRSSKDISQLLGIGLSTVESHRRQLKTKLHIKHFAGLVKFAIREGLTSVD